MPTSQTHRIDPHSQPHLAADTALGFRGQVEWLEMPGSLRGQSFLSARSLGGGFRVGGNKGRGREGCRRGGGKREMNEMTFDQQPE